jgi:hypothetical protein
MEQEYKVVSTFEKQHHDPDKNNTSLFRSYTGVEGKQGDKGETKRSFTEQVERQKETEQNRKVNQEALNNLFSNVKSSGEPQPTKLIDRKKSFDRSSSIY